MLISDLIRAAEAIAHPSLAEEWDNVGLLVGSTSWALGGPVLLTIDLTDAVAAEAVRLKCGAVIAYHPPLFHSIKRMTDAPGSTPAERIALSMIRAGIAVYSPHTALDAAMGGLTSWLADGLAGRADADRRALRPFVRLNNDQQLKIVTFVPESAAGRVRDALASAGAGLIGNYEICSFAAPGVGTFRGNDLSRPTIGIAGSLESAPEHRLEMVCARKVLALALATLRQFHPYEEPAIDVYPLEPQPDRRVGAGRRLMLDQPATLAELADRLKKHLGVEAVHVGAPGGNLQAAVSCIGLVPGAGASLAQAARADGCDVFVTGEMKHHEVNAAIASGLSVILGGHTATERGYLPTYARRLKEQLPQAEFIVSTADKDPLQLR